MYDFFKQAAEAVAYSDLQAFLAKLDAAWARDLLTDAQLDELRAAAQENAPRKVYDLQDEVDRLWAQLRVLQTCIEGGQAAGGEQPGEAAEFVQPTGAHDAYRRGDVVRYQGKLYTSLLDGNVWAPDVYPGGWQETA